MLPNSVNLLQEDQSDLLEVDPTLTYRLDTTNKRIIGKVSDAPAVLQYINKVLSTDKYAFEIYDWYYGNELMNLVGKPYEYIVTEIPRIIREALTDERIKEIKDFEITKVGLDSVRVTFKVVTVYGLLTYEFEVST